MKLLIPYLGSVFAFVVLDFLWIGVVMSAFYRENLGHLMGDTINLFAAAVFYLLYTAGVFIFAVLPSIRAGKGRRALMLGAMLGLIAYGTYDLSNQATLEKWPLLVTVVDMVWGTFLTALMAVIGFSLTRLYNQPKDRPSPVA